MNGNSNSKKICVVTGTRAEYGLLYWVIKEILNSSDLKLQLVVTAAHLSQEHGETIKEIENDGMPVAAKVSTLGSGDSWSIATNAMARGLVGFTEAFEKLKPDLLLILGDRYELLPAAQVAMMSNVPIAHIAGGDITEGAVDNSIRHALTKFSHLHFVTNEASGVRIRQMGENPDHFFNFGSPGLDHLLRTPLFTKSELESELKFSLKKKNYLITFHPETIGFEKNKMEPFFAALDSLHGDVLLLFTGSNADPGGRVIDAQVDKFVAQKPNRHKVSSLGHKRYLSCMKYFDMVIGNSSSGLYEAPSFKIPTVNIGDRQKGRLRASSVVDCELSMQSIKDAIKRASDLDCSKTINPYGDGHAAEKIVKQIRAIPDFSVLLNKKFYSN